MENLCRCSPEMVQAEILGFTFETGFEPNHAPFLQTEEEFIYVSSTN